MQDQQSLETQRGTDPLFKIKMKSVFFIFLHLFNENILKQQHGEIAVKSAKVDVLELLKLQNFLYLQPW